MTWRTPLGDRTLTGTEADLFITAVQLLAEDLYIFGDNFDKLGCMTGNPLFDTATTHQKLYLLNDCLPALLRPATAPPQLTHILEATVYFPFAYLEIRVEAEVEAELEGYAPNEETTKYFFRYLTWKVYRDYFLSYVPPPTDRLPNEEAFWEIEDFNYRSTNLEHWEIVVKDLVHRVVEDGERWKITAIEPSLADGANARSLEDGITNEYLRNRIGIVSDEMVAIAYREIHNWSVNAPWT